MKFEQTLKDKGLVDTNCYRLSLALDGLHMALAKMDLSQLKALKSAYSDIETLLNDFTDVEELRKIDF